MLEERFLPQQQGVNRVLKLKSKKYVPPPQGPHGAPIPISLASKGLLTNVEAAEYLNLSPNYLDQIVTQRRIQCYKLGHTRLFKKADLDRYREETPDRKLV